MGVSFFLPLNAIQTLFNKKQVSAVMTGVHCAGKSTILAQMKLGAVVSTLPAIGFEVETVEFRGSRIACWSVGDHNAKHMGFLRRPYYQSAQALIFVVDSSDPDRMDDAREELSRMIYESDLENGPLLVIANKSDASKFTVPEIEERLEMNRMKRPRHVQTACALTGEGLEEGFKWLTAQFPQK